MENRVPANGLFFAEGLLPEGKDALVLAMGQSSGLPFRQWMTGRMGWVVILAVPPEVDLASLETGAYVPELVYYAKRLDNLSIDGVLTEDVDGDGHMDLLFLTSAYGMGNGGHHKVTIVHGPDFRRETTRVSNIWPRNLHSRLFRTRDGTLVWLKTRFHGQTWLACRVSEHVGVWAYRGDLQYLAGMSRRMATVYLPTEWSVAKTAADESCEATR